MKEKELKTSENSEFIDLNEETTSLRDKVNQIQGIAFVGNEMFVITTKKYN